MKITKKIEVFDNRALTKGSIIKINGFACIAERNFNDDEVEVFSCSENDLTVKYKRRKYIIQSWEHLYGEVEIEMVKHKPEEPKELPF